MTPIKLLHIVNEFSETSVNLQLLNLMTGLDHSEYEIHVGYTKAGSNGETSPMGRKYEAAGAVYADFHAAGRSPLPVAPIVRYIHQHQIQVVHTHILRSDLLGIASARLARTPLQFSTKHNIGYIPGQPGWLFRSVFYWPTMYLPDQIVSVSQALKDMLVTRLHINPEKVAAIHNSIDVEKYHAPELRASTRESLGIKPDAVVVAYVGRMVEGKGLADLLQAAQRIIGTHKDVILLFAGDGPVRQPVEQSAQELGIMSNVIFAGFRQDIPAVLAAIDIFVLPSESEGLPQSIMEAMAASKAVVATLVGGIPELIEPERTGLLVAPKDVPALTAAIEQLITNRDRRLELGEQARAHAQQHFSVARMASAYDELYRRRLELVGYNANHVASRTVR